MFMGDRIMAMTVTERSRVLRERRASKAVLTVVCEIRFYPRRVANRQYADVLYSVRLLRVGVRPCKCHATEESDELASPHMDLKSIPLYHIIEKAALSITAFLSRRLPRQVTFDV
jgi:hypothetical protein